MPYIKRLKDIIKYYDDAFLDPNNNNEITKKHIILSRKLVQLDLMIARANVLNKLTKNLIEFYLREMRKALTELLDVVEILLENNLINEGVYLKLNDSLKVKYESTEELERTGECKICMRIN
jgi:hypothetical protein